MSLNIVNHYQYKHNTPVISKTLMPYFASHLIKKEKRKGKTICYNDQQPYTYSSWKNFPTINSFAMRLIIILFSA